MTAKENGNKVGYKVGKGKPPVDHQFTSNKQPSTTAKSKGWERRREAQAMMDRIKELGGMTVEQYLRLRDDIKQNPQNHTMNEAFLVEYIGKLQKSEKMTLDYIDRHVSKAPTEITGADGKDLVPPIILDI